MSHLPRPLLGRNRERCITGTTYRKCCTVCYGYTDKIMIEAEDPNAKTTTLSISCHGSKETKTFSDVAIQMDDWDYLYGAVYDWLIHAFEGEEQPEVKLVIAYNQGRAMPEGERVNR